MKKTYVLAITGASGSIFGLRVLQELARVSRLFVCVSSSAIPIVRAETALDLSVPDSQRALREYASSDEVHLYRESELHAPIASGSVRTDGMLIVPCSIKTLSAISQGQANNLIERSADVTIKEGRKLLLSPREMPFSAIHLENMLKLARLGVRISPPVPAFYHNPKTLESMIDFIVGKILDGMGEENELYKRWEGR